MSVVVFMVVVFQRACVHEGAKKSRNFERTQTFAA